LANDKVGIKEKLTVPQEQKINNKSFSTETSQEIEKKNFSFIDNKQVAIKEQVFIKPEEHNNIQRNEFSVLSNRSNDVQTHHSNEQVRYSSALSEHWTNQVMNDVTKTPMVKISDDVSEIRLRLHPENLGDLVINVKTDNGKLSAQIVVSSSDVRHTLESNLTALTDAFSQRGLEVRTIDIRESNNSNQSSHQQNQDSKSQNQNRHSQPYDEERAKRFARYFGYNTLEYTV